MLSTPKMSFVLDVNKEASNLVSYFIVTSIAIVCVWYFQWHWNRRKLYEAAAKFNGPMWLPFLGNALILPTIAKDFFGSTPKLFKKYGSPIRAWMGPRLFVAIDDVEDTEHIFTSSASVERADEIRFVKALGNGLVTAPAHIWKSHRKLIQPTFNQQILDTFVDVFAEQSEILAENLKADIGTNCDIMDRIFKYSMDSICETSMGVRINSQEKENVYGVGLQKYLDIAFMRMYKIWQHPEAIFKRTSYYNVLESIEPVLRAFSDNILRIKREERAIVKLERTESDVSMDLGFKKKTFMELLLDISDDGSTFTDQDIRDETATMIAAGSDTTASTDCFILICLALYPDIQEQVYEEVMEQLGPDRAVEKNDLAEFKYLERVIKETMRFFPIFPFFVRKCDNDVKLSNDKVIPAGGTAVIMLNLIHKDPRYWNEPAKFNPNRFLPETSAKRNPYAYLAFGAGPRNCVGQKYGMMSMKTTIATLVRQFKFYTDYKTIEDVNLKIESAFTKPENGFKIRFVQRC